LRDLGLAAKNPAVAHSASNCAGCRGTQMLGLIKVTLESAAPQTASNLCQVRTY